LNKPKLYKTLAFTLVKTVQFIQMSKILFIDCETTDVTPLSGQIIELAGVVVEADLVNLKLKVLDQFTTLVKNRGTWDERIQRLTGITQLDLQKAPALMVCQERWANWLEPWLAECGFICGHSVDFDLRFLQAESWLLPDSAKVIDTLPISKVCSHIYPQLIWKPW
jgi:DNA polymerase III, alpha subunit (gram-positive type)